MIILDENIITSQRAQLRKWRIRFRQIGKETGRQGMKDLDEIIPLLHRLRRPTFFTHDLGFFDHALCHKGYTLICLDVRAKETAVYIRRCLRHPEFQAEKQRLGKVILARQRNLSFWESENRGYRDWAGHSHNNPDAYRMFRLKGEAYENCAYDDPSE